MIYSNEAVALGAELRRMRSELNFTRSEAAHFFDFSVSSVAKFEAGGCYSGHRYDRAIRKAHGDLKVGIFPLPPQKNSTSVAPSHDTALGLYNRITADVAALYRLVKIPPAYTSEAERPSRQTVTERAAQAVTLQQEKKRIKSIHARNQHRAEQRPLIASLHAALRAATRLNNGTLYRTLLDKAIADCTEQQMYLAAYIELAEQMPVPDDSPLVTLPEESI